MSIPNDQNTPASQQDEILLVAETLGELSDRFAKIEKDWNNQSAPLAASKANLDATATALAAVLTGLKSLDEHVLRNDLGAVSKRVESVENLTKSGDEKLAHKIKELSDAVEKTVQHYDAQLSAVAKQKTELGQRVESSDAATRDQFAKVGAMITGVRNELAALIENAKTQFATPTGLNPRGDWMPGTYQRLDVVTVNGTSYIATQTTDEKPTAKSSGWQVLARRGISSGAPLGGGATDITGVAGMGVTGLQIAQAGTVADVLTIIGPIPTSDAQAATTAEALAGTATDVWLNPLTGNARVALGEAPRLPAAGAYFDGVSGFAQLPTTVPRLGDSDGGFGVTLILGAAPGSIQVLVGTGRRVSSFPANTWTLTHNTSGGLSYRQYDSGGTQSGIVSITAELVPVGVPHRIHLMRDKTNNELRIYLSGSLVASAAYTAVDLDSANPIRAFRDSATAYHAGGLIDFEIFNDALSTDQVLAWVRGGPSALPQKIHAAGAGTSQTSGTLVIGKRYRITTFVSGDNFTNVGAGSNATGVEFTATGTTPTTYTNGSTLTAIGLCGRWVFDGSGAGYQERDRSGGRRPLLLSTTGVDRLQRGERLQVTASVVHGGAGNLQLTGQAVLPDIGWRLIAATAKASANVTIQLGNASGGSQLVGSVALTSGTPTALTIAQAKPTTVNAWSNAGGAATVEYTLIYERDDII